MHKTVQSANKWRDSYNPLRSLTLARAVALQEAYNRGEMADLQWTYMFIEQADPDLLALVERRTSAIMELDWNIKLMPEPKRYRTFDQTLADEQAAALREEYERLENLYEAIEHLSMAAFRGFSLIERQGNILATFDHWNVVRDGFRGLWKYNPEAKSCGYAGLPDANKFDPALCLVREVRRRINYYGLYKFIRSNLSSKDWDAFIEIYGLPGCIVIMPENVPSDKVAEYRAAAEDVAEGASGALPAGSEAKFSDSPRGVNPFRDHMQYLREQLVMAGTGGLLTMLAMPQGIGSGASDEHGDAFETIARAEARRISEVFQKQFDKPALARLFPGRPVLAYFEIAAQESVDVGEIIDHAVKLSSAGYQVDPAELAEKTGYQLTLKPADPGFGGQGFGGSGLPPGRSPSAASTLPNRAALGTGLAAGLGVDAAWLAPVADLLADLEAKAADKAVTDADLAAFIEAAAARLPELFEAMDHDALAAALESALGGAVLASTKLDVLSNSYDPSQPRNEDGEWTSSGVVPPVKWKTSKGDDVEIDFDIVPELDRNGYKKPNTAEVKVIAKINGQYHDADLIGVSNHPVAVAKIGKIGISSENYAKIQESIKEAQNHPKIKEYMARIKKAEDASALYEKGRAAVIKAMNPD